MKPLALVAAMVIALLLPRTALSQGAEIEGVITSQIEAFKADDLDTAFSFASPMIQNLFGSPERFGEMVQNGYPMVLRPDDMRFLGLTLEGSEIRQRVMIRDGAGRLHFLDYYMVPGDDGWLINGVRFVEPPTPSA